GITFTHVGGEGTFTLDGHDLSHDIAADGVTITTDGGAVNADVRLLSRALEVSAISDRVTVHTTPAQEALLRAGGWAKEGDICINGDLLWAQSAILNQIANYITEWAPRHAQTLRSVAD